MRARSRKPPGVSFNEAATVKSRKGPPDRHGRRAGSCFNEAATVKSRKANCSYDSLSDSSCFNEAATVKSRKERRHGQSGGQLRVASMRPRLLSRGKNAWPAGALFSRRKASMRPRLLSRGKTTYVLPGAETPAASMRPRLLSRGKSGRELGIDRGRPGFNEAATVKSRKAGKVPGALC